MRSIASHSILKASVACISLAACAAPAADAGDDFSSYGSSDSEIRVAQCPASFSLNVGDLQMTTPALDGTESAEAAARVESVRAATARLSTAALHGTLINAGGGKCYYHDPNAGDRFRTVFRTRSGRSYLDVAYDVGVADAELRLRVVVDAYTRDGLRPSTSSRVGLYASVSDPGPFDDDNVSVVRVGSGAVRTACAPPSNVGPGSGATDQRTPELGDDLSVVRTSAISMSAALRAARASNGAPIEAKFELDDSQHLSLSIYPTGHGLAVDAERNVFQELSGDPTAATWHPDLATFAVPAPGPALTQAAIDDAVTHLLRSARDLTLVQLSSLSLEDAVTQAERNGLVYWAIPTLRDRRAGYGVYYLERGCGVEYAFVDGGGSSQAQVTELGTGPGMGATDQRTPELGNDLSILASSHITMAQALATVDAQYGGAIEAKFELDDSNHLSLSIYPTGHGLAVDAERNVFQELSGDPTAATWHPDLATFAVPAPGPALTQAAMDDAVTHLLRSARDLTLVQAARLTITQAVAAVNTALPGGFVYWAIPTIRGTRAGYGVYSRARDGSVHYYFVS